MNKGLVIFATICVVASWGFGVLAMLVQDVLGPWTIVVLIPLGAVPLIAAYIGHRVTGAPGNPFKGLVWGSTGMIFGMWLLGILAGGLAAILSIGLGLQQFDLSMESFIQMTVAQSAAQGRPIPEDAQSFIKISGWTQVITSPLIGAWIGAAISCLSLFPWLGWFGRRVLVRGKATTLLILIGLFLISGLPLGLMENPQLGEMGIPLRLLLMAVTGFAGVPLALWLFLSTRSVVIPSIAVASINAAAAGTMPLLTEGNMLFTPPSGLLVQLIVIGVGIALWVWKDPGGEDLAIAAVAYDGTPLTPAMVEQLQAEEAAQRSGVQAPAGEEPEPPAPPDTGGVADNG